MSGLMFADVLELTYWARAALFGARIVALLMLLSACTRLGLAGQERIETGEARILRAQGVGECGAATGLRADDTGECHQS